MYQPVIRNQWSPAQKRQFFAKHNNMCDGCHATDKELEIHHIVPLACGGLDDESNCSAVCHQCHDALHKELNNRALGVKNSGRKPKLPEEYEVIALDYMFGYIGREECRHLLGDRLEPSDLKRHKWFKNIMKGAGVKNFNNAIDFNSGWGKNKHQLSIGDRCGWVELMSGEKKWMFYKTGIIEPDMSIWR